MDEKYKRFDTKRLQIFNELVSRYWNGGLNGPADLEVLSDEIRRKYGFSDDEITFVNDHIRVAMGLDPKGDSHFTDEIESVKSAAGVKSPVVVKIDGPCAKCDKKSCECNITPKYDATVYKRERSEDGDCLSCGGCVSKCDFGALADKIEFLPVIDLLKNERIPVYAAIAPAAVGQFGELVTMGQLRTALKQMGFEDMVEVALFADMLTIKEAVEFNRLVKREEDFFLTSCCCPIWFNMIKKSYPDIYKHLSPSVSPMIASGRILKKLYENAKIVFIAPCIAKKAEIKEPDLEGAVDFVLNFRELKEIFDSLGIDPSKLQADDKDQASLGGRMYARTGGVSFSVKTVVNRLEPARVIKLKPKKVDGVPDCRKLLDELRGGDLADANFIEGMGCKGGCVGGPRVNIDTAEATKLVNSFGEDSFILTPFDNLNIAKILENFGIDSVDEMMSSDEIVKLLSRE